MANADKEKTGSWLTRWRAPKQQEQRLTALQEGFHELVGMTRAIREHMEQQAETQKTLVEMMKHVPGAVEGLQSVGRATQQQTETLALLKKQLESSSRNEEHLVESMRNFNKTLTLMDEMSKSTSQTVSSMADRTRDSEDMLRSILERSERRLIAMIVTLMVVTLTVLGMGLYIGLGPRFGSGAADTDETVAVESATSFQHKKSISELGEVEPTPVAPQDAEPAPAPMQVLDDSATEEASAAPADGEDEPVVEFVEEPAEAAETEDVVEAEDTAEAEDAAELTDAPAEEVSVEAVEEEEMDDAMEASDTLPDSEEEVIQE